MNRKLITILIISSLLIQTGTYLYIENLLQNNTDDNSSNIKNNRITISFLNKTTYDSRIPTKLSAEKNKLFYGDIPSFFTANLSDLNDRPLNGKLLKLYRQVRSSFYEIGNATTDAQGIANFSVMFSNLPNGTYTFKVVFEGDQIYASNEAFSKFRVIQDAPHGELTDVRITDGYIHINYRVWTTGVWIIPGIFYKHDALGLMAIHIFKTSGPGVIPPAQVIVAEGYNSYSKLAEKKSFEGSFSEMELVTWCAVTLTPGEWVGIRVYVEDDDSYDWDPFDGESEIFSRYYFYQVEDEDINPPSVQGVSSSGNIIDSPAISNYEIYITARDYSGWSGKIEYYYKNSTFTSSIYTRSLGTPSSSSLTTLKASIPRSEFSQFVGTSIYYRYQLYDGDNDYGGTYYDNFLGWIPQDSKKTEFSEWICAGTIFGEFGVALDTKLVYSNLSGLNPYINEEFALIVTAVNPLNTPVWLGSFDVLCNDSRISAISDVFNQNLNPGEILTKTIYNLDYKLVEADLGANDKLGLKFTLNLNYVFDNTSDVISEEREFAIEKPPLPIITFKGFSGYKESTDPRLHLYQYKDGAGNKNTIKCKIDIYNPSRVKMKLSEQILPSHAIIGDSIFDTTQFNKLRILQNTIDTEIDPFQNKTLEFSLRVEDPKFYIGGETRYTISVIFDFVTNVVSIFEKRVGQILDFIQDIGNWYLMMENSLWNVWREYNLTVSTTSLQYYIDNVFQTVRTDPPNPIPIPEVGKSLILMPSGNQFAHLQQAFSAEIAADVASWVAQILVGGDLWSKLAAAILFGIEALLWWVKWNLIQSANVWDPEDLNYEEVFEPTYTDVPIMKNETLSISSLVDDIKNITSNIAGDSEALQVSINRKNTALLHENYSAAKMQTEAIEKYATKMAENVDRLGDFEIRLFNEIRRINETQEVSGGYGCLTTENISRAKAEIAMYGLPEEEIKILDMLNFTQEMIENITNTLVQRDEEFLQNMSKISVQIKNNSNTLVSYYEDIANEAFKEGIDLSTTYLEQTIKNVTKDQQELLEHLKNEIEVAKQEGRWNDIEQLSKELIEKAKEITVLTGNLSILYFIDYAQNESNKAKDIKTIDLTYNIRNSSIIPGTQEIIDLIILNKQQLAGTYTISVKGISPSWYTLQDKVITFKPNDFEKVILLTLNPPRKYYVEPGFYTVQIEILDQYGKIIVSEEIEIQIHPYYEIGVEPEVLDFQTTSGTVSRLYYNITNVGNIHDVFLVIINTFEFPEPKLALPRKIPLDWIQLSNTEFSLAPGQFQIFSIDILIPMEWKGFENVTYRLNVTAYSLSDNNVKDESAINVHVIATETSMVNYLVWEIDNLNEFINHTNLDSWRHPAENRRTAMIKKIEALKLIVSDKDYGESYDKLLHDIKPKLTGLKTNEEEIPWGNGVFKNPWITNSTLQEILRELSNEILLHMTKMVLIFS